MEEKGLIQYLQYHGSSQLQDIISNDVVLVFTEHYGLSTWRVQIVEVLAPWHSIEVALSMLCTNVLRLLPCYTFHTWFDMYYFFVNLLLQNVCYNLWNLFAGE